MIGKSLLGAKAPLTITLTRQDKGDDSGASGADKGKHYRMHSKSVNEKVQFANQLEYHNSPVSSSSIMSAIPKPSTMMPVVNPTNLVLLISALFTHGATGFTGVSGSMSLSS